MAEFFVICQPGLEAELRNEIEEFWPYLIEKDTQPMGTRPEFLPFVLGGVGLLCSEIAGLQINFFSKLASRVLLRIGQFKAKDFAQLRSKISKFNLHPYFSDQKFRLEIAAAKSRLNNEKRIGEVCQQVWPQAYRKSAKAVIKDLANESLSLFIRVFDDEFTLSVDTSGEHLHFRQASKKIGEAPLRETLAAFMLRNLIAGRTLPELQKLSLTDPMAGSGTLLIEARELLQINLQRQFAFQQFPSCAKILQAAQLRQNYPSFPKLFQKLEAFDLSEKMLEVLRANLQPHAGEQLRTVCLNSIQNPPKGSGFLIVNPPYGERIQANFKTEDLAKAFLSSEYGRVGILLPEAKVARFIKAATQFAYEKIQQFRFKNGGIPVCFLVYQLVSKRRLEAQG